MAESLTGTIATAINMVLTNAGTQSTPKDELPLNINYSLTSGTAIDQADRMWHDQRTLAGGANETLDLSGVLSDGLGQTFSPARVKAVVIRNKSTTVGNGLVVGAAASNAWNGWTSVAGSTLKVGPNGLLVLIDPSAAAMAVTAGTGDQLKIANAGATSVTYDIVVIGASA